MAQYDVWRSDENAWGLQDPKILKRKEVFYYTTTVASLEQNTTYVRRDPLNPEELAVHRPDLPFTAARNATQSWFTVKPEQVEGPAELPIAELFLRPFTATGASGRMTRLQAENGISFTPAELVRRGQELLADIPVDKLKVDGVGIHRLGIRQGIPAYYLWGPEWKGAQPD